MSLNSGQVEVGVRGTCPKSYLNNKYWLEPEIYLGTITMMLYGNRSQTTRVFTMSSYIFNVRCCHK